MGNRGSVANRGHWAKKRTILIWFNTLSRLGRAIGVSLAIILLYLFED